MVLLCDLITTKTMAEQSIRKVLSDRKPNCSSLRSSTESACSAGFRSRSCNSARFRTGTLGWILLSVVFFPSTQAQGLGPGGLITRPPQVGDKPIVANGIVYYLNHIPVHCQEPYVARYPSGGIIDGKRALLERDNPHEIYGNIQIPAGACLWIEPGSVLKFGPGFGIIVNGTLIARVGYISLACIVRNN